MIIVCPSLSTGPEPRKDCVAVAVCTTSEGAVPEAAPSSSCPQPAEERRAGEHRTQTLELQLKLCRARSPRSNEERPSQL